MDELQRRVTSHYEVQRDGALAPRLIELLVDSGADPDSIGQDELSGVDEFHLGGRSATVALIESLVGPPGRRILDVGCGIGGPARTLATQLDCHVTGVDLTPDFVAAAAELSRLAGLEDRTAFVIGSATALDLADDEFDAATVIHVGMNIEDKAALMAELRRVVRPAGRVVIYDIMRVAEGDIDYPVPWAANADASFLAGPDDYRAHAEAAGLTDLVTIDRRALVFDAIEQARSAPPAVNLRHLMGEAWPTMFANLVAALEAGIVSPVQLTADAPG